MPENKIDFGVGFASGFAKGGVEMVGGIAGAVVATGKLAVEGGRQVVRGVCWSFRVVWKTVTGQSLEMERRQAAEVAAKARKANEKAVKITQFFRELKDEGANAIEAVLAGDFQKLNHMSGHMRTMISSSIEIFEGLFKKFESASDYNKGFYTGRATFEISSFFVPFGAAFKAIQVAGRVSKARFLTNLSKKSKFFQPGGKGKSAFDDAEDVLIKAPSNLLNTRMCFIAGTLVATAHAMDSSFDERGLQGIETIRQGSIVWAMPDDGPGTPEPKRVLNIFKTYPDTLHHVSIDHDADGIADETLSGTHEHPFWEAKSRRWVEMGNLEPGQQLYLIKGTLSTVLSNNLQNAPPGETFTTYNFEVEDFHTYFVGESGVWVHNTGQACELAFSTFNRLFEKHTDIAVSYRQLSRIQKRKQVHQGARSDTVWGLVQDGGEIDKLRDAGKLDARTIRLGIEGDSFDAREAFAGARFELQQGKTLRRGPTGGADFIEDLPGGGTRDWDAKGPFNPNFFKWEGNGGVKASIDKHYRDHGVNKDESVMIDLAGLSPGDAKQITDYLQTIDPAKELYEIITD